MSNRSEARTQFLGDIITTALEGGVGYWSQASQYQWVDTLPLTGSHLGKVMVVCGDQVGDQAHAVLHEMNDDETGYKDEPLELTIDKVASAIQKIANHTVELSLHKSYRDRIRHASDDNDCGNLDSLDCDIIVQVALLGDVIYG